MKNYAKVGGKPGRPGYRTPSVFQYRKSLKNKVNQVKSRKLEAEKGLGYNRDKKTNK